MKNYLLDTNVLINDPRAFYSFQDNIVLVPILVIEELDGLKKRIDVTGTAARAASKELDRLREKGKLSNGVQLDNGGILKVIAKMNRPEFVVIGEMKNDHYILQCCMDNGATLVTEDINMRILADCMDIPVERYENAKVNTNGLYEEHPEFCDFTTGELQDFWDGTLPAIDIDESVNYQNAYFSIEGGGLGRIVNRSNNDVPDLYASPLKQKKLSAMKIDAKNREQHFAMDALMDPTISLVVLSGKAGTGKTLLAVAAGLQQATEAGAIYDSVTVARPIVGMGNGIGFLPGTEDEKLMHWMMPIVDAISVIIPKNKNSSDPISTMEYYKGNGHLNLQSLETIRGRSMPRQFIIIDEAQQLTQLEIKTILTRAGEGAKIVLTGDANQIDSKYIDQYNCGMTYAVHKFMGKSMFAFVNLTQGERSELAEIAAEVL